MQMSRNLWWNLSIANYDLICIGIPVHHAKPTKEILSFLEEIPVSDNKRGIAFCTHSLSGDKETNEIIKEKMEEKGIKCWQILDQKYGTR